MQLPVRSSAAGARQVPGAVWRDEAGCAHQPSLPRAPRVIGTVLHSVWLAVLPLPGDLHAATGERPEGRLLSHLHPTYGVVSDHCCVLPVSCVAWPRREPAMGAQSTSPTVPLRTAPPPR